MGAVLQIGPDVAASEFRAAMSGVLGVPTTEPAIRAAFLLGMPQLAMGGLSENWLWKECGHLHWMALAGHLGLEVPDFRDSLGRRIYAAFTAIRLREARFEAARENCRLEIETTIARLTDAQFASRHLVSVGAAPIAEIEMISAFVIRATPFDNRSITRAYPVAAVIGPSEIRRHPVSSFHAIAQNFRRNQWERHCGFDRSNPQNMDEMSVRPCPLNDFNGADFLYFANFQLLIDKADWQWNQDYKRSSHTVSRDIFYRSNINVGETVTIRLCGRHDSRIESDQSHKSTWCQFI